MPRRNVHFTPSSFYKKPAAKRDNRLLCQPGSPEASIVHSKSQSYQLRKRQSTIINQRTASSDEENTSFEFEDDDPEDPTFQLVSSEVTEFDEVNEWIKDHFLKTQKQKPAPRAAPQPKDNGEVVNQSSCALPPPQDYPSPDAPPPPPPPQRNPLSGASQQPQDNPSLPTQDNLEVGSRQQPAPEAPRTHVGEKVNQSSCALPPPQDYPSPDAPPPPPPPQRNPLSGASQQPQDNPSLPTQDNLEVGSRQQPAPEAPRTHVGEKVNQSSCALPPPQDYPSPDAPPPPPPPQRNPLSGASQQPQDNPSLPTQDNGEVERQPKKYPCIFCKKLFSGKIRRHLKSAIHQHEPDMMRIAALTTDEQEKELDALKHRGIRMFNIDVLEGKRPGNVIVHGNIKDTSTLKVCIECNGTFSRKVFYRHKHCTSKKGTVVSRKRETEEDWASILEELQDPQRRLIIANDDIAKQIMRSYMSSHNMTLKSREILRGKLNMLARCILLFRTVANDPTAKTVNLLQPSMFGKVITVAEDLAKLGPDGSFGAPTNARSIGLLLSECAKIWECSSNQQNDIGSMNDAIRFQALYAKGWNTAIGGKAQLFVKDLQRNSTPELPLVEDIRRLSESLKTKIAQGSKEVVAKPTATNWRQLANAIIAYIILFNRRRVTEVGTMTLQDFRNIKSGFDEADKDLGLTELEKRQSAQFERVELLGKRHRPVPILIKKDIKDGMNVLMQTRMEANINPENKFVFALAQNSKGYIRGDRALSEAAATVQPPLQHSDRLKSTALRKQIATISQILDMTGGERENLATYLGHSLQVHAHHYQLPLRTLQAAKLGALFCALDDGTICDKAGRPLRDIDSENHEQPAPRAPPPTQDNPLPGASPPPPPQDNPLPGASQQPQDNPSTRTSPPTPDNEEVENQSSCASQQPQDNPSLCASSPPQDNGEVEPADLDTQETSTITAASQNQRLKRPWSSQENDAIKTHFAQDILLGRTTTTSKIKAVIKADIRLASRCSIQVRAKISNEKKKERKHFQK